jgi:hypothetical protein
MKALLFIICIVCLMGCRNNRKDAIETICKEVKSTEKTCRSAVGISGRSTEYIQTK